MPWNVKIKHGGSYHKDLIRALVKKWPWQTIEVGTITGSYAATSPARLTELVEQADSLAVDLNSRRRSLIPRRRPREGE